MDRKLKRRRWAVRKKLEGWKTKQIYESLQIPRRTFYNWWQRYQEEGWKGLENKSRRPKNPKTKLNDGIIQRILEIRRDTNFGPNKIEIELKMEGISIGHTTIYNVLRRFGMNNSMKERDEVDQKEWKQQVNKMWEYQIKSVVQNGM